MMDNLFSLPIASYQVVFTIKRGRGLVAKDRHFLTRRRTTSDPYAVAFLGMDRRLGRTRTCDKTLEPVWDATFTFTVPNKRKATVPTDMSTFLGHKSQSDDNNMIEACALVLLKLYDHDEYTDDDMMGTLLVPIPATRETTKSKRWYAVDNLFVPNAVGQVEVELQIKPVFGKRQKARDLLPSPETFARWTAKMAGKEQAVNKNNVVVETETDNRKGYVLAMLKKFAE